jgi:hypothetical protein
MPDLILWLCAACGPVALVLYWRDRHARAEHRNLLAAAIAQRDGALARASDAEDAVVNWAALATVHGATREGEPHPLPATHPQRRRQR